MYRAASYSSIGGQEHLGVKGREAKKEALSAT